MWQMAASCIPLVPQQSPWGWQHPRSPHSRLEARNRWWLWHFLFIDMAGDNFISHCYLWCSHQGWFQTTVGKIMCFHAKSGIAHSVLPVGTRLYPCTTFELTVLRVVGSWCWNLHNSTSRKKKKFQHQIFKWPEDMNRRFISKTYRWPTDTWKDTQGC